MVLVLGTIIILFSLRSNFESLERAVVDQAQQAQLNIEKEKNNTIILSDMVVTVKETAHLLRKGAELIRGLCIIGIAVSALNLVYLNRFRCG